MTTDDLEHLLRTTSLAERQAEMEAFATAVRKANAAIVEGGAAPDEHAKTAVAGVDDGLPKLIPRTFPRGDPSPLFVRRNRRTGAGEFVRTDARFDGRGNGRATPYPLGEVLAFEAHLSTALRKVRSIIRLAKGARNNAAKSEQRRRAIQDFALSIGWPERHTPQKVFGYFAHVGGKAPKDFRCSERTVKAALQWPNMRAIKSALKERRRQLKKGKA